MAGTIEKIAWELGEKIAAEQGVYLVDISYDREKDGQYLRLYIDKTGSVGIEDCEAFSVRFGEEIDQSDPIAQNYCLEVSSPGVDRTLKKEREFLYYLGRSVDVKLYKAVNGAKELTGILKDYKDKTAYILVGETLLEIPLAQAVYIKLTFRM